MVFVGLNYRVGPFGFLASEKVREDGDLNVGLLDQREALKWVQKHITKVSCATSSQDSSQSFYLFSSSEAIQTMS